MQDESKQTTRGRFEVPIRMYSGPLNGVAPDGTPFNGVMGTAEICSQHDTREEAIEAAREHGALGYYDLDGLGFGTLIALPEQN